MASERADLFGIRVDRLRRPEAVAAVLRLSAERALPARYVVTPNVDHLMRLQEDDHFRTVYADASLVTADGKPLVWASRWLGDPLPETVTGSDLVPALFDAVQSAGKPLRVYLFGAGPGVADRAAGVITQRWPCVEVVGTCCPPMGFENDANACRAYAAGISAASPDVLIVGLGAPKQEFWVHRWRGELACGVALCVGATIDFIAGEKKRAPVWMQRAGLEWFHRMATEPRRLARRYLGNIAGFLPLLWREWRRHRGVSG